MLLADVFACLLMCLLLALQDGPISHHNHLVDLPEFNSTNFWALYEDTQHGPPLFDGACDVVLTAHGHVWFAHSNKILKP